MLQYNQTRFIVLSKKETIYDLKENYKTSIIIMNSIDNKPGMLSEVLNEFSIRNINLLSIMSRPTKASLGKYFFFIDIEGNYAVDDNIIQVKNIFKVISDEIANINKECGYKPQVIVLEHADEDEFAQFIKYRWSKDGNKLI